MKINDVVEQTGLNKRTIYYYMEEQLISPKINPSNGYYIFSQDDVVRLKMLRELRKLDFSIKDILSFLSHPQSAHIYLQKQIEKLQIEYSVLADKIACLTELEKKLPFVVSYEYLSEILCSSIISGKASPSCSADFKSDAKLVSLYLWGNFLQGIHMTEYRQFLWEKVLKSTAASNDSNIAALQQFLYSLSAEQIDTEFSKRNLHIEKIINLSSTDVILYAQNVITNLKTILSNEAYIRHWKLHYHNQILPSTCIFDSGMNALIYELSPRFSLYSQKMQICCGIIYEWLCSQKGEALRSSINKKLKGYIDLSAHHHGELAAFFSLSEFFNSPK